MGPEDRKGRQSLQATGAEKCQEKSGWWLQIILSAIWGFSTVTLPGYRRAEVGEIGVKILIMLIVEVGLLLLDDCKGEICRGLRRVCNVGALLVTRNTRDLGVSEVKIKSHRRS